MNLDLEGFAVSSGSACSSGKVGRSHVLDAMGVAPAISSGAIRVSLGWNTTADDVSRFISTLNSLRARHTSRRAA
jgi:cysteine desulfurase